MDYFRHTELSWTQGYNGQEIYCIDNGVFCYQCGLNVNFHKEDGSQHVFSFKGRGIGPFTVHRINKHFAMTEECLNPSIYVFNYPNFENVVILEGGSKIKFQSVVFSYSNYLLSLSSLPDFELILWDYIAGQKLTGVRVSHDVPTSLSFNPANWHQICLTTALSITIWSIEQCNDKYILLPQNVRLPIKEELFISNIEDSVDPIGNSTCMQMSRYKIDVPQAAAAGLIGDSVKYLSVVEDEAVFISPISHTWTPDGDIFVSSTNGYIVKVDGESYRARQVFSLSEYLGSKSRNTSTDSKLSTDVAATDDDREELCGAVSLNCLALHRLGLFAISQSGVLYLFNINGENVDVIDSHNVDMPVTSLTFSFDYMKVTLGSSLGSIVCMDVRNITSIQTLCDVHYGDFVGIGILTANVCVTTRSNGMIQVWSVDDGVLLSSLDIGESASCLTCSPLAVFVVVGSVGGNVYFVDITKLDKPRIVHRKRLYTSVVQQLIFDQEGLFLFSVGNGSNVFVLDGRPSSNFLCHGYTDVGGEVRSISAITSRNVPARVMVGVHTGKFHQAEAIDCLVQFDLRETFLKDLKTSYQSMNQQFKDNAIDKLTFFLLKPALSVVLGEDGVAYCIGHSSPVIQTITLPSVIPKRKDAPEMSLTPEGAYSGHQLNGGKILLSQQLKSMASYGPDGCVILRSISYLAQPMAITAHNFRSGGVQCFAFSNNCQAMFTSGYDGVLSCYRMSLASRSSSGMVASADIPREASTETMGRQNIAVRSMAEWQHPPPPLSQSRSVSDREQKVHNDYMKKQALEREDIYRTPTPNCPADSTWLQEKEYELSREEDKRYADTKRDLREQIRDVRKSIQKMIKDNEQLPEIEKLGRHEFDLDIEEQIRLQAQCDAEIEKLRDEIDFDNLAKQYVKEIIKRECWDNMSVKGRSLLAFNSTLEVSNFPLIERSPSQLEKLDIVVSRRNIELQEAELRNNLTDKTNKFRLSPDDETADFDDEGYHTECPALTGGLGEKYGGENELFYSQFELHLRHQKISQIILLEDAIFRIKVAFNRDFDDVFRKKEQEICKIREKNKRITVILNDFSFDECCVVPEFSVLEKPELLFTVNDDEVKFEKYLTPEQQKTLEAQEKAEEEKRIRERGDNQTVRALDNMMGGVLEIRKEDELKKDIPIPLFIQQGKDDEEWSDDERKLAKEYERKVVELNEEREKLRKQLEMELRKLQAIIQDGMAAFDETFTALFMKKTKVMMVLYQEELKILRIRQALLLADELCTWEKDLHVKLDNKRHLKQLACDSVNESRKKVEEFHNEYDILVAEDKVMDKAFKREFHDVSAIVCDQLYRLFKKRPRGQKFRMNETYLLDGKNPNPFAERPSTALLHIYSTSAHKAALNDLDKLSNAPDGLDSSVWSRLCQYRRSKVDMENNVKQKALTLSEMQAFLQKRQNEEESLNAEIEDIISQLNKVKQQQQLHDLDIDVQLMLRQGQVEVDAGTLVHNYTNSVLVHRSVIEELNASIKQLGESKIASMLECKDFKKGIVQLEWEHKRMLMQMEDFENKMTDIKYMKVTREIQAYLNEDDYETKQQNDIALLEKTIQLQKSNHIKRLAEKKKMVAALSTTLKQKEACNSALDVRLNELNVTVNERRHIDNVSVAKRSNSGCERRYREIVERRKLVDLAKAQAEEIAVLRSEVERLRMRTFPALVQVDGQ